MFPVPLKATTKKLKHSRSTLACDSVDKLGGKTMKRIATRVSSPHNSRLLHVSSTASSSICGSEVTSAQDPQVRAGLALIRSSSSSSVGRPSQTQFSPFAPLSFTPSFTQTQVFLVSDYAEGELS